MKSPSSYQSPRHKKPSITNNLPVYLIQKGRILQKRLQREQICSQHKLISNMNQKLQLRLDRLIKYSKQLDSLSLQQIKKVLSVIPFIQIVSQLPLSHHSIIRLQYVNIQRTIILTGITKQFIDEVIKQFRYHNYQSICRIVGKNQFWTVIQADTVLNALNLKKGFRSRKRMLDLHRRYTYKQDKKRVRIVMQSQDFYTLLVDAMTQKKNIQFNKRLVHPQSGMFPKLLTSIIQRRSDYYPNQQYQLQLKNKSKLLYLPYIRDIKDDYHFNIDDAFSQQRSKTSDVFDRNSQKDLVEKTQTGIQAQRWNQQEVVQNQHIKQPQTKLTNHTSINNQKIITSINNQQIIKHQFLTNHKNEEQLLKQQILTNHITNKQIEQDQLLNKNQLLNQDKLHHIQKESSIIEVNKVQKVSQHLSNKKSKYKQKVQLPSASANLSPSITLLYQCTSVLQIQPLPKSIRRLPQFFTIPTLLPINISPIIQQPLIIQTFSQTDQTKYNYTKMKRLENQYRKISRDFFRRAYGIPQEFRKVTQQERNRALFFHNIFKNMSKTKNHFYTLY